MIDVYVLAVGLIALVMDPDEKAIHLLFLDTDQAKTSWGEQYHKHEAKAFIKGKKLNGESIVITAGPPAEIPSFSESKLAQMYEIHGVGAEDTSIRARRVCFESGFRTNCKDEVGQPVVQKVVTLKGTWTISGVDVKLPPGSAPAATLRIVDDSVFQYVSFDENSLKLSKRAASPSWGAYLIHTQANLDQVKIEPTPAATLPTTKCAEFLSGWPGNQNAKCLAIVLSNLVPSSAVASHKHQEPLFMVDKHFDRFYDLMALDAERDRFYPIMLEFDRKDWRDLYGLGAGGGAPGGVKCERPGLYAEGKSES